MARFVPNHREIARLTSPSGTVGRFMTAFGRDVESRAESRAPVDTGALRASMHGIGKYGPSSVNLQIGTDPENEDAYRYAVIVHQGRKAISVPPQGRKKAMAWTGRKAYSGRVYITNHVGPAAGQPYLTSAFEDAARARSSVIRWTGRFDELSGGDTRFPRIFG